MALSPNSKKPAGKTIPKGKIAPAKEVTPIVKKSMATKLGESYGAMKNVFKKTPPVTPATPVKSDTPVKATTSKTTPAPKKNATTELKATVKTTPVVKKTTPVVKKGAEKVAEKVTKVAEKSVGNTLVKASSKLKGKGKLFAVGAGLLAAGIGAGREWYNSSKSSPVKKSDAVKKTTPPSSNPPSSPKSDFNKGKDPIQQYGVVKPGSSTVPNKPALKKTTPNKITKPISFKRDKPITLSGKTEGFKSQIPVRKTAEGVVKNVSLPPLPSPLSKRATMKGLRKEKRSERKLTRMDRREDRQDRRENRIINKTAKLKAKR